MRSFVRHSPIRPLPGAAARGMQASADRRLLVSAFVLLLWGPIVGVPGPAGAADGPRGVVATVHPMATQAAVVAFAEGGNAVDAAVAAALTLGVVDNHNSGMGGGCFILLRLANRHLTAIDGRETAPAAASRDMFVRDGNADPELSRTGPLASGVPGALAAYAEAVRRHGRLPLARLLAPAAAIAEQGFPIDAVYARRLASTAPALARFQESRALFLQADGTPYGEGQRLRQPDLARTYRAIAREGIAWFYEGPFARRLAEWMADNGGLITVQDMSDYRARVCEPVVTTYRDWTIVGFPPPSSGGIHVAQILNILENFDLKTLRERDPARWVHVIAEAEKRAFSDRAYWLGDADYADVPRGLVDKKYARVLADQIDQRRASIVPGHGDPTRWDDRHFGKHTTHIAAADAEGNWAAITATINTSFGSKVVIPGTGVVLNNEMDDFSAQPGVPNVFGLIGADANAVAPGKRPLSSMSPTIVLRDGRPILTVGAAGGPKIITQTLLMLVRCLDLDHSIERAVRAPRFHHQWRPDKLLVNDSFPPRWKEALRDRGHTVECVPSLATIQAVAESENGLVGVHDPSVPGDVGTY